MAEKITKDSYYEPVEERVNGGLQGYKYGSYRSGMVKDDGTPLKKNGRKTGYRKKTQVELGKEMGMIMNWCTFGKKEVENEKNIKAGVKPNQPMNISQACLEMGYTYTTFRHHLNNYPNVKLKYDELKESRILYMQEIADSLIGDALEGKMKKLSQKDRVDYAFRLQEKTNQRYNPKQVIENNVDFVDVNRKNEDILEEIADLIIKGGE